MKKFNNLENNNISIGKKLYLSNKLEKPIPPSEDNVYVVKKGDTLYSISRKFNISVDKLKEINNIKTNTISVGQQLIVKDIPYEEEYNTYIVKKGDSLWSISQKYNITVNELIDINDLDELTLQINQELKVPKVDIQEPNEEIYIVKKGDTLWSISRDNGLSVNEIKQLNNLTSNLLSVGQSLKIKRT